MRGGSRRIDQRQQALEAGAVSLFAAAASIPADPDRGSHPGPRAVRPTSRRRRVAASTERDHARRPTCDRSRVGRLRRSPTPGPSPRIRGSRSGPSTSCRPSTRSSRSSTASARVEIRQTEIGIPELFNLPPGFGNSDPRVIYDSLHGRWVGTEVSWTCDGDGDATADDPVGYIDFIVSRTADPTGVWDSVLLRLPDELPDFPAPGHVDRQARVHREHVHAAARMPDCLATSMASARHSSSPIGPTSWRPAARIGLRGHRRLRRLVATSSRSTSRDGSASRHPATSATLHLVARRARPSDSRFTHPVLPQDHRDRRGRASPSRSRPN